jgi:hypothetical protein
MLELDEVTSERGPAAAAMAVVTQWGATVPGGASPCVAGCRVIRHNGRQWRDVGRRDVGRRAATGGRR